MNGQTRWRILNTKAGVQENKNGLRDKKQFNKRLDKQERA